MIGIKDIPFLILILILATLLFFLFVDKRPFTDEGSFCTIAEAISNGSVLYRDIYNEKAPIPYFLAALFVDTNGDNIKILRKISFVAFLFCILLLYLLLKKNGLTILQTSFISVFYIQTAPLFQSFNYTSEILSLPIILFIINRLYIIERSKVNIIIGFLTIILVFIKQPFILFSLLIMIFALSSPNIRRHFFIGVLFGIVFIFLLLLITKSFLPFVENLSFIAHHLNLRDYARLPYRVEYYQFILILVLSTFLIYHYFKKNLKLIHILLALSLLPQGMVRMDAFKLLPFFTVLIIMIARLSIIEQVKNLYIILLILSVTPVWFYRDILNQNFDSIKSISYTVETKTDKKDSIWVAPHEANIYCLSHRRPSSRFFFLLPWISKSEVFLTLIEDLVRRDPPECIVDVSKFNNATTYNLSDMFAEFGEIIKNYKDVMEINGAIIYCKK